MSLCNVDYKLFAKVICGRLQLDIADLIGSQKVCGIQTHIHIVPSILETVSDETGQVSLNQIDRANGFDKARHDFLLAVVEHANIGDVLLSGIRLCYKESYTGLTVNQEVTKSMPLQSSVRQGCPLSPFCLPFIMNLFVSLLLTA